MTSPTCLDCEFEGSPDEIREHRAVDHRERPATVVPVTERIKAVRAAQTVESELYLPGEVARLFRVDPKTITRWAKEGRLPCVRTLGGHRRYRVTLVHALLEEEPW